MMQPLSKARLDGAPAPSPSIPRRLVIPANAGTYRSARPVRESGNLPEPPGAPSWYASPRMARLLEFAESRNAANGR